MIYFSIIHSKRQAGKLFVLIMAEISNQILYCCGFLALNNEIYIIWIYNHMCNWQILKCDWNWIINSNFKCNLFHRKLTLCKEQINKRYLHTLILFHQLIWRLIHWLQPGRFRAFICLASQKNCVPFSGTCIVNFLTVSVDCMGQDCSWI